LVIGGASAHAIAGHVLTRAQEARAALSRFLSGLCLNGASRPRMMAEEGEPATVIKDAVARLRPDLVLM
jgi:hypothetical protein